MSFISRYLMLLAAAPLCLAAPAVTQEKAAKPVVVIVTTLGDITVELNPAKAPKSVENFLAYAKDGFYRGTIFHRVVQSAINIIQGGGFTPTMERKNPTRPPVPNEAGNGLSNKRGTIAMARTMAVNSATSQFFINTTDNLGLDHRDNTDAGFGYAVFGKVVAGMGVVDKIAASATGTVGQYQDVPIKPIFIKEVKIK